MQTKGFRMTPPPRPAPAGKKWKLEKVGEETCARRRKSPLDPPVRGEVSVTTTIARWRWVLVPMTGGERYAEIFKL